MGLVGDWAIDAEIKSSGLTQAIISGGVINKKSQEIYPMTFLCLVP